MLVGNSCQWHNPLAAIILQLVKTGMEAALSQQVNKESFVSEIVRGDYRTADVFRKYGINYCCGGRWPLQVICDNMGLDATAVVEDLNRQLSNDNSQPVITGYHNWEISFLIDFISNVNHRWLKEALPVVREITFEFVGKHTRKFPALEALLPLINQFEQNLFNCIQQEEQSFFPYIRQLQSALAEKESYGSIFVRTLGKPLETHMLNEQKKINRFLDEIRLITETYTLPAAPCTSHHVAFKKLQELDRALVLLDSIKYQTLYMKAIDIEKKLGKANR